MTLTSRIVHKHLSRFLLWSRECPFTNNENPFSFGEFPVLNCNAYAAINSYKLQIKVTLVASWKSRFVFCRPVSSYLPLYLCAAASYSPVNIQLFHRRAELVIEFASYQALIVYILNCCG